MIPTKTHLKWAFVFACCIFFFLPSSLIAQVQFEEITDPPPYPISEITGVWASSIAFADIDNDGDQDVLVSGLPSGVMPRVTKLYTNDGNGAFTEVENTPFTHVGQPSIAFADVNNDGSQDVLITGYSASGLISQLYLNDGFGNYSLDPNTPFPGVVRGSVTFLDLNNNGNQDVLITGDSDSGPVSQMYTNDGNGNFTPIANTPFVGLRYSSAAIADINNDGYQDVLISGWDNNYNSVSELYINDGNENFSNVVNTPFQGVKYTSVAFADFNNDGNQDVILTASSTELFVNDGFGNFSLVANTPFTSVNNGNIAITDINNDGNLDVIINGTSTQIFTNDGTGNFLLNSNATFSKISGGSVAFADVNGDGNQDVLLTGASVSGIYSALYFNKGNSEFYLPSAPPFPNIAHGSVACADIDNDGYQDVFITGSVADFGTTSNLYTNNGDASFSNILDSPLPWVQYSSVAFADVNNDGNQDILVTGRDYDREAKLFINDGVGNFSLISEGQFLPVEYSSVEFADIDNDGDQDVLITGLSDYDGQFARTSRLYINNGLGNFTVVPNTPFKGVENGAVAFADVNNDGSQDVLIAGDSNSGSISELYVNDGSGSFSLVQNTAFPVGVNSLAFADFNNDGSQDVVLAGTSSQLFTNDGSGNFTLVASTPFSGNSAGTVAVADFNNDGNQDVMITGSASSQIFTNDGTGDFSLVLNTPFSGVGSSSIAVADIDNDGMKDVFVMGTTSEGSTVKLYRNISTSLCPITASCQPITIALNASGNASIAPSDIDNGSTVSCGSAILSLSKSTFDCSEIGTHSIILTVTDSIGNFASCEAQVTVIDSIAPEIICGSSGGRFTNVSGLYIVNSTEFDPQSSTDNCSETLTLSHNGEALFGNQGLSNSSLANWEIPLGIHSITFTLSDQSGNEAICDVQIEVKQLSLTGSVSMNLNCTPIPIRVELYEPGTPNLNPILVASYTSEVDVNGNFQLDLPGLLPGTYGVYVKVDTYLQKFLGDQIIDETTANMNLSALIRGDIAGGVYGDNLISASDLSVIIAAFSTMAGSPTFNWRADLDCNAQVNILDVSQLVGSYNISGDDPKSE